MYLITSQFLCFCTLFVTTNELSCLLSVKCVCVCVCVVVNTYAYVCTRGMYVCTIHKHDTSAHTQLHTHTLIIM